MIRDSMYGMQAPDVERWSERVVVVRGLNPGPFTGPGTNTYLVGTGERPLLIDTGAGVAGYVPLLERALAEECRASAPGDIAVTHVHADHIGGARDVLARFAERAGDDRERKVYKRPWPGRDEKHELSLTPLHEGDRLTTPGATLRALHTPGHAEDHLCFYLEEERALFTGDLVLGAGTTVIPLQGGDMRLYLESLERLLDLDLARIYPGHGPMIRNPGKKLREYIDHRLERERQIIEVIRAGARSVSEMVERIYVDTPRSLHAAAGQSVLSHLLKLEGEKRAWREVDAANQEYWSLA